MHSFSCVETSRVPLRVMGSWLMEEHHVHTWFLNCNYLFYYYPQLTFVFLLSLTNFSSISPVQTSLGPVISAG